jgi:dihydropteroate synthase
LILPEGRPAIMGILNVTPDSFSDGGSYRSVGDAVDAALRMVDDGADLIDIGGESTRPGASPVSLEEEMQRVLPVVEALANHDMFLSVDTRKAELAWRAVQAGAFMINDVGGLRDPEMLQVCVDSGNHACIMHMQGTPETMQDDPVYGDVVGEVRSFLVTQCEMAKSAGIPASRIWIDPGIGFGKTIRHNLDLLRDLDVLVELGYPVLIGVSRKGFIGKLLGGSPAEDRLEGTLAAQAWAQMKGGRVLRVHDVRAARRASEVLAAVMG